MDNDCNFVDANILAKETNAAIRSAAGMLTTKRIDGEDPVRVSCDYVVDENDKIGARIVILVGEGHSDFFRVSAKYRTSYKLVEYSP